MFLAEISDTIKVFDVLTEMPLEHLSLYFENFKRANGGPSKSVQLIAEKKQAIIQYKNSKGQTFFSLMIIKDPLRTGQ